MYEHAFYDMHLKFPLKFPSQSMMPCVILLSLNQQHLLGFFYIAGLTSLVSETVRPDLPVRPLSASN